MSEDMSMFKKMKDKITDEVNTATNKLQNTQFKDQLNPTISQQTIGGEFLPHLTLPSLNDPSKMPKNSHFTLVADDDTVSNCDEELNSEISPQHQLFNESAIGRIKPPDAHQKAPMDSENGGNFNKSGSPGDNSGRQLTVINIDHLSSDIDTDPEDANNDEVDLLNEKEAPCTSAADLESKSYSNNSLAIYKTRYRDVVHLIRKLNRDFESEKNQHECRASELKNQIAALKLEIDNIKNKNADNISLVNVSSDSDVTKHNSTRQGNKLRDLEKLMAKCKESLKAKNSQLNILKGSLAEVDKFKDYINAIKNELQELKNAHETWTLSIAENKRYMHQEIEEKNNVIEKLKAEIHNLNSQIKDGNDKSFQLKLNIQSLESRLVSTSAAHQKERESLTRELVATKNNAIKQLQKAHDMQLERVKLDLEKSIEKLKSEILVKDEQLMRYSEKERELQSQNSALTTDLENTKSKLNDYSLKLDELRSLKDKQDKELDELRHQIDNLKSQDENCLNLKTTNEELATKNQELEQQVESLTKQLSSLEQVNGELRQTLEQNERAADEQEKICQRCLELQDQMSKDSEKYEQTIFELNTKLDLMATANGDQEKALQNLKCESDKAISNYKTMKLEFDELSKRNETLSQVIQDSETQMQSQQDQLKHLASVQQQLDNLKRENSSLASSLAQVKNELNERNNDLMQSQETVDNLKKRLTESDTELKAMSKTLEVCKNERDSLASDLARESSLRHDKDQQLVVTILAAMKNLETPETSPGSDKTYKYDGPDSDDPSRVQGLPNPVKLAEELASLASDRCNAYVTTNQRLETVLLDNSKISEEIRRLKEELNALNKERTREIADSLGEVERLRTENQALIHDQKAYDDQIASMENEIELLRQQLIVGKEVVQTEMAEASTETVADDQETGQSELLEQKEQEISRLKQMLAEKDELARNQKRTGSDDVPDPTEFKYLKNIVYQFMMGREPTTLARVISAVFKFDDDQVDQICKVQDAIHQASG